MAAPRSPIIPVLTAQVVLLFLLTIGLVVWLWRDEALRQQRVDLPLAKVQTVRSSSLDMLDAPYQWLGKESDRHVQRSQRSHAMASQALDELDVTVPRVEKSVAKMRNALDALEGASARVFSMDEHTDQHAAFEELVIARKAVDESLSRLERRVREEALDQERSPTRGVLALWGIAVLSVVGTALYARSRELRHEEELHRGIGQANSGLAAALRKAALHEPPSGLPQHWSLQSSSDAAGLLIGRMGELRERIAALERHPNVLMNTTDALSLTDGPVAAVEAAAKVVHQVAGESSVDLLRASASGGELHRQTTAAAPLCRAESAEQCPALRRSRVVHSEGPEGASRCSQLKDGVSCALCLPMNLGRGAGGVLQIGGFAGAPATDELLGISLILAERLRNLEAARLPSGPPPAPDPLTGLLNRTALLERMAHLDRGGEPYALLVVDIDDLSVINEAQGRERGDQALRLVGSVLKDVARASDFCARYGEEEFALVMPGANLRGALSAGMRLRGQLQDSANQMGLFLTVSAGAAARPEHGQGVEALLRAAEGAVVDAKEMGKDQLAPARVLPPIHLPQV